MRFEEAMSRVIKKVEKRGQGISPHTAQILALAWDLIREAFSEDNENKNKLDNFVFIDNNSNIIELDENDFVVEQEVEQVDISEVLNNWIGETGVKDGEEISNLYKRAKEEIGIDISEEDFTKWLEEIKKINTEKELEKKDDKDDFDVYTELDKWLDGGKFEETMTLDGVNKILDSVNEKFGDKISMNNVLDWLENHLKIEIIDDEEEKGNDLDNNLDK